MTKENANNVQWTPNTNMIAQEICKWINMWHMLIIQKQTKLRIVCDTFGPIKFSSSRHEEHWPLWSRTCRTVHQTRFAATALRVMMPCRHPNSACSGSATNNGKQLMWWSLELVQNSRCEHHESSKRNKSNSRKLPLQYDSKCMCLKIEMRIFFWEQKKVGGPVVYECKLHKKNWRPWTHQNKKPNKLQIEFFQNANRRQTKINVS